MYKIVLYGSSEKVVSLYNAILNEKNVEVLYVIVPENRNYIQNSDIPKKIIKSSLKDIMAEKDSIFAILNVDDDESLKNQLIKLGLDNIKVISGTSAAFLYELPALETSTKKDYLKIVSELKNIANNISMLFDREKLLNEILRGLCSYIGATRGSIMLFDNKESVLKIAMAYGIDRILWDFVKIPLGEGIAGTVANTKKPVIISGSPDDRNFKKLRKREDIKSAICVPLVKENNLVGVLNLANQNNINAFSEKDLTFVVDVSKVITDILFTSKSFTEYREDAKMFKTVSELSKIISEKLPIQDKLNKIVGYFKEVFGVHSLIAIYGGDEYSESVSTNLPFLEFSDVLSENTIERKVFLDKKEICFIEPDCEGFKGYLSLPLIDGDTCFGVLSIINFEKECNEKTSFFKELASQISRLISLSYQKEGLIEQNRRKELIDKLVSELTLFDNPVAFGSYILHNLAKELDAKIGVFRIYDEDRKSYVVKDVYGMDGIIKKEFFQIDREIVKKTVLTNGEIALVKNTNKDKQFFIYSHAVHSFLIAPLHFNEQIYMTFSFYNSEGKIIGEVFSKSDKNFILKLFEKAAELLSDLHRKRAFKDEEFFDALTGLPNFRYFESRVYDEVMRAKRHGKRVIILVGEFEPYEKYLNAYGKKTTDNIIKSIATQIREKIRSFEVVARLNVNKFGVVLVDADEKTLEIIFRLKKMFEKEDWDPKHLIDQVVTVRYGFARFPEDGEDYDELIIKANHIRN